MAADGKGPISKSMKPPITAPLILLLSLFAACSTGRTAADTPCHADMVQTSPGVILPLESGQTFQVYPTDNHISMVWQPLDNLLVCPLGGAAVEITNLSDGNKKIKALQIFDLGWYILQGQPR